LINHLLNIKIKSRLEEQLLKGLNLMNNKQIKTIVTAAITAMFILSFTTLTLAKKGENKEGKRDGNKKRGHNDDRPRPELNDVTFTGTMTMMKPKRYDGDKGGKGNKDEGKGKKDGRDDDQRRKHQPRSRLILTAEDGTVAALMVRDKDAMESLKEHLDTRVTIVARGFKPKMNDRGRGGDKDRGEEGKGNKQDKESKHKPQRPSVILVKIISISEVK
jgi:hypothetical protein